MAKHDANTRDCLLVLLGFQIGRLRRIGDLADVNLVRGGADLTQAGRALALGALADLLPPELQHLSGEVRRVAAYIQAGHKQAPPLEGQS